MPLDDIAATVGLIAAACAIGGGIIAALWKLFRKIDQLDDTSNTAEATAQAMALLDRRLVDVQQEVIANGGASVKDVVLETRAKIVAHIEDEESQLADLQAGIAAQAGLSEIVTEHVEADRTAFAEAREGHNLLLERLDALGNQAATDTAKVIRKIDDQGENQ